MKKETFVFYKSWLNVIQDLPSDVQLEVYQAIAEYATNGKLTELKPLAKVAFSFIKQDIDRDTERYISIVERNRNNGIKGGRPKQPKITQKTQVVFSQTQNNPKNLEYDNEYDNDLKKDSTNVLSKKSTPKFDFKKSLVGYGFTPQLVDDWLVVRRQKKSSNTETAFKAFVCEVEKFISNQTEPIGINDLLQIIVSRSWSGFKASWDLQEFSAKNNTSKYNTKANTNNVHTSKLPASDKHLAASLS